MPRMNLVIDRPLDGWSMTNTAEVTGDLRLAQNVQRIADALERQVTEENLAESVRIWG